MVTLGTGPRPVSMDDRVKLLPSHSYAVTGAYISPISMRSSSWAHLGHIDVSEGEEGRAVTILDSWVCPGAESSERLSESLQR